ncbi:MAG: phage terminase family protein [Planctomycetia bacterium]|nr:phage terminase family protein [Planctomycetia bacterium]
MVKLPEMFSSPRAFREALFIETDTGPELLGSKLDPWQAADFASVDNGWKAVARNKTITGPVKLRAYFERPRGHSKTADLAVQVSWVLFATQRMISGVAAAADKDQARLLRDAIEKLISLNPWLSQFLEVQAYKVVNKRSGSTLEILSADAASSYGLTPDFIVLDEITHWINEALFVSLFSAAAKKGTCMLVTISNAGVGQGKSWQWNFREAARLGSEGSDADWHFSTIDGPQASWISPKHLAEQRRILPPVAFDRLWLNKWTTGQGDAITEADILRAITMHEKPTRESFVGATFIAGLDLGIKRDASAIAIGGCEANGGRVRLAHTDSWKAEPGKTLDLMKLEEEIVRLHKEYGFDLFYDPWQAELLAQRLRSRGISVHEVPFSGPNLQKMASATVETFSEGQIELYNDAALLDDLRSLKVVEKSYGYRIDAERGAAGHADRAIALALMLHGSRSTDALGRPGIMFAEGPLPDVYGRIEAMVAAERAKPRPDQPKRLHPWFSGEPSPNAIQLNGRF